MVGNQLDCLKKEDNYVWKGRPTFTVGVVFLLLLVGFSLLLLQIVLASEDPGHQDGHLQLGTIQSSDRAQFPAKNHKSSVAQPNREVADKIHPSLRSEVTKGGLLEVFIVLTEQPHREIIERVRVLYEQKLENAESHYKRLTETTPLPTQELVSARGALNEIVLEMRQMALREIKSVIRPGQDLLTAQLLGLGAQRINSYVSINVLAASVPHSALDHMEANPLIAEVFPVVAYETHLDVSVKALGAQAFWNSAFDGGGQDVAVLDTGLSDDHPAFSTALIIEGNVFLPYGSQDPCFSDDLTTNDNRGHGTHVAGIVASQGGSFGDSEKQGVAKGIRALFNYKIAYKCVVSPDSFKGKVNPRDVLVALDHALQNTSVRIFNLSFGGGPSPSDDNKFAMRIDELADLYDLTFVISAGNDGPDPTTVNSPGIAYNILSVANMDDRNTVSRTDDILRYSSSRGPTVGGRFKPDIAAPGTNISSTAHDWNGGFLGLNPNFVDKTGTSMAAPHIAGAVALLRDAGVSSALASKAILLNSTGNSQWDDGVGWGYADLASAFSQRAFYFTSSVWPRPQAGHYRFYVSQGPVPTPFSATLVWNRYVSGSVSYLHDLDLNLYRKSDGWRLDNSSSFRQNVEKVSSTTSTSVVIKVDFASTTLGRGEESFALAASSGNFSPAGGPSLTINCNGPFDVAPNEIFRIDCTARNNGDLEAFSVEGTFSFPSGWSGGELQRFGNLAPSQSVTRSWSVTAPSVSDTAILSVSLDSRSYGESFSDRTEVNVSVSGGPGDTTPPVISGVTSSNITSSGATITWTTNEPSTSRVEYGPTTVYGNSTPLDSSLVTSHSVNLSGLTASTFYHYRVRSLDAAGNLGLSGDFTFTTAPPVTLAIERVSVDSNGLEANGASEQPSVSADGRFVAFASLASNLTAVDTQGVKNIFLRDRQTGETLLVSVGSGGAPANQYTSWPTISADGNFVAFYSSATNLVAESTNAVGNIFVYDRLAGGVITLLSRGFDGSPADGNSCCPSISADGRLIAFQSSASNLIAGDTNGVADIFVHDRQTGASTRVSVSSNGAESDGRSGDPVISADGRFVAFYSGATNLVASDTNGYDDIFVHDLQTGETTRESVTINDTEAYGHSYNSAISADGLFVAFDSWADNLVTADTNGSSDVFLRDRQTGQIELVSVASDGTQGDTLSGWPSPSADGRFVAFASGASNLVSGASNGDILLRDRLTGQTNLVASLGFNLGAGLMFSLKPEISADGRFVGLTSLKSNLVTGDTNGVEDVFVAATGLVGAPVAVTAELSDGNVGTAYSRTLRAIGGTPPYTWGVVVGSLPAGLSLNSSTGEISGSPTTAGTFGFTVEVTDSANPSQTGTRALSITVISLPIVSSQSVTTAEETPITITLTGIDPENDPLTFSIVTDPTHGTLSPITPISDTSAEVTYTPNTDFNGLDSFSFKVNDGALDSNPATVSISVNAVNDAPVAQDDAFNLEEDSTLNVAAAGVLANDTDVDGDSLTAILASGPTNGSLTLNSDGSFSYVPSPDFNGTDSFTYKANDGTIDSNTATVSITVTPVNYAPVANAGADQTVAGTSDSGASVTLDGSASSDFENDTLTYTWTGPFPEGGGAVTGLNPTVTLNFGTSTITLVVNDGQGDSAPDTLDITITDFTVGTSPSSVTVSRGQSASYTVTVSPQFGSFDATVSLSCSNLPSLSSCSFSPATLTPGGSDATSTLTVSTTAPSSTFPRPPGGWPGTPVYVFWLGLVALTLLAWALTRMKPQKQRLVWQPAFTTAALMLLLLAGCGGGGGTPPSPGPTIPGTPSGTHIMTVTGASGSLTRSITVTLVVQ